MGQTRPPLQHSQILALQSTHGNEFVQRRLRAGVESEPVEPAEAQPPGSQVMEVQRLLGRASADRAGRGQRAGRPADARMVPRGGGEGATPAAATAVVRQETEGATELDADVEELLESIDVIPRPRIPTFEAIVSTTSAEYTSGELEGEIQRLWSRQRMSFTAAARRAAAENTAGEAGPRATQGPQLRDPAGGYAHRWALNLFAWDSRYAGGDLPEVQALMRDGSPFQDALTGEFERVTPLENPTARKSATAVGSMRG